MSVHDELAAARIEERRLRVALESQTKYSIALQRVIEGIRRGRLVVDADSTIAPYHYTIGCEIIAMIGKLRCELELAKRELLTDFQTNPD